MKNKILITAILLVTAIIALLISCKRDNKHQNSGSAQGTVRMASFFTAVDYAPYLIAKNKGWFDEALKDNNFKVEYSIFQSLAPINESFATGRIDIVFEAEPPAIIGESAGHKLDVRDISCSLIQQILVPTNSAIKSVADLKGKKIAVLSGTSSHYGLLKLLKEAGVKPNEVEILDMAPPDAKVAFEANRIDAWAVWPPFDEQEELSGKGRALSGGDAYIHSIMAVREKFISEHPDIFKEIDEVFEKSKKWMEQNPEEAIAIVSKELNVPLEVVKKAWPRHNWKAVLDQAVIQDIQEKANFLKETGKIQNELDVKKDLIPFPDAN